MACRVCAACFRVCEERNKERGKEMDKSLGCDHQYPQRPKPSENSLKDSELNICFIEVICTKRMLLKWCVLSECVCEKDRWSEGGKGSARGALPVLKCKRRPEKSAGLKVPRRCGFPVNSSLFMCDISELSDYSFLGVSIVVYNAGSGLWRTNPVIPFHIY